MTPAIAPLPRTPLSRTEFPRHMTVTEARRRLLLRGLVLVIDRDGLAVTRLH